MGIPDSHACPSLISKSFKKKNWFWLCSTIWCLAHPCRAVRRALARVACVAPLCRFVPLRRPPPPSAPCCRSSPTLPLSLRVTQLKTAKATWLTRREIYTAFITFFVLILYVIIICAIFSGNKYYLLTYKNSIQ